MIEFKYKPGDVIVVRDFVNDNKKSPIPYSNQMTWLIGEEHAIIARKEYIAKNHRRIPAYYIDTSCFVFDERWLELVQELVPREERKDLPDWW